MIVYPDDNYDSWISEGDAWRYFNDRLHADPWHDADCIQQEQALQTAFRSLQELALNFDDLDSSDQDKQDALLDALKQAQCEQALHELKGEPEQQDVSSVSLGGMLAVSMSKKDNPKRYSPRAVATLKPYLHINTITRVR